jgi:glutamyl/glutaminyl-tRNA synthetase
VQKFSLSRVQRSGARFDEQRLLWMNGHFIRQMPPDELYARVQDFWPPEAANYDDNYKKAVLGLVQERLKYFGELPSLTNFFFQDLPINSELWTTHKQLKKVDPAELQQLLQKSREALEQSDFSTEDLMHQLNDLLEQSGQKPAVLFSLVRIATTQAPASPSLAETLAVLGRETAFRRIDAMLATL